MENVILNTWKSDNIDKKYFREVAPIFERGDYRIFKQFGDCYLYTFKNIAISQLAGLNKGIINNLIEEKEPVKDVEKYLYRRMLDSKKRGLALL